MFSVGNFFFASFDRRHRRVACNQTLIVHTEPEKVVSSNGVQNTAIQNKIRVGRNYVVSISKFRKL